MQMRIKLIFDNLDLSNDDLYTFYLDNEQTSHHHSFIFNLQELNSNDCSKNFVFKQNFTSDFYLRIYASGCYYLDQNNDWQSDGLIVSLYIDCSNKHSTKSTI